MDSLKQELVDLKSKISTLKKEYKEKQKLLKSKRFCKSCGTDVGKYKQYCTDCRPTREEHYKKYAADGRYVIKRTCKTCNVTAGKSQQYCDYHKKPWQRVQRHCKTCKVLVGKSQQYCDYHKKPWRRVQRHCKVCNIEIGLSQQHCNKCKKERQPGEYCKYDNCNETKTFMSYFCVEHTSKTRIKNAGKDNVLCRSCDCVIGKVKDLGNTTLRKCDSCKRKRRKEANDKQKDYKVDYYKNRYHTDPAFREWRNEYSSIWLKNQKLPKDKQLPLPKTPTPKKNEELIYN